MTRVLLVHPGPNFSVADVHNGWAEAFRALGCQVAEYNLDDRLNFYTAAFLDTGKRDAAGLPQFVKALDQKHATELAANGILSACYQFWPDIVVCVSAFFTPPWLLEVIRRRGHKLVLLHTESPYQDGEQLQRAVHASVNLLNDPVSLAAYQELGPPAEYVPHAYRPTVHHPGAGLPELACDIAFSGTGYPSRIGFFHQMNLDGLDVLLAGNWMMLHVSDPLRSFLAHDVERCLDNEQTALLYQSAKAGINIYRREAEAGAGAGWAMGPREVEMAACGLFYVRDPRPEGDGLLPMLPRFTSPEDASDLLRWHLDRPAVREAAAAKARDAVAGRTFDNSVRQLLRLLDRQPVTVT